MTTKFFHYQGKTSSPLGTRMYTGFTVAYTRVDNQLLVGVAICNENDRFCKKLGRMISEGRMKKNPHIVPLVGEESPEDVAREFGFEMFNGGM